MTEQEITDMKAALEAAQASITALEKTNKDLKAEKAAEKRKADDAQDAREAAEREANEKSGDVEKIKADLAKLHKREIDKLNATIDANNARLSTLLIDNEIASAITKNGVLPHFAPAVTAMLRAGATMENGEAMADGTPLADKITSFFKSEDARHYVAAPANSGGGAQGSSAKAGSWAKPPETAEEFEKFMRESLVNPAMTNALADSWARPDLKSV